MPLLRLACLAAAALAIHGYHLGVEDSEIFVPAAARLLHPSLYPFGAEFFQAHQHLSLFSEVLAGSARLTHLSMDWTLFLWYLASVYALLAACWLLAETCFHSPRARWCAILVVTAVLTMPASNTGLLLADPYLTPRSLSTPLLLFALVSLLHRRYLRAALITLAAAAFHPQMAVYFLLLAALVLRAGKSPQPAKERVPVLVAGAAALPFQFDFSAAHGPYREALYARDYFFLSNWTWYHWLGLLAPLAFLAWFARGRIRRTSPQFQRISAALIPFGLIAILVAAVLSSSHTLDMFARLQPLRCFHLITLVFVLLLAGVVGEYAARRRPWVLPALALPLALGMACAAWQTYPDSSHIELPGRTTSVNAWVNALFWIRDHTPTDAVFAVDSRYFKDRGVDQHGFRTLSRRSDLADYFKDGGAVAMFPSLAVEWKTMSNATYGLNHFSAPDFVRLAQEYPVTWTVIHGPAPQGMACPYNQRGYVVCRIPSATTALAQTPPPPSPAALTN